MTVGCGACVANAKCYGTAVYSHNVTGFNGGITLQKGTGVLGLISDFYRNDCLAVSSGNGNGATVGLINSPIVAVCVIFTGIGVVLGCSCGNGNVFVCNDGQIFCFVLPTVCRCVVGDGNSHFVFHGLREIRIYLGLSNLRLGSGLSNLRLGSGLSNFGLGSGLSNLGLGSGLGNFGLGSGLGNLGIGSGLGNLRLGSGLSNFGLGSGLSNLGLGSGLSNLGLGSGLSNLRFGNLGFSNLGFGNLRFGNFGFSNLRFGNFGADTWAIQVRRFVQNTLARCHVHQDHNRQGKHNKNFEQSFHFSPSRK